jgi:hypothetical protein
MENKIYKTKDLPSASFLVSIGRNLIDIERRENKCWFVFEGKDCEKLVNEFYFGHSYSQIKSFYDAMQSLKTRIFT